MCVKWEYVGNIFDGTTSRRRCVLGVDMESLICCGMILTPFFRVHNSSIVLFVMT